MIFLYAPALIRIMRTSTARTAKCLSFCVLLLSLTPMATLYLLLSASMPSEDTAATTTTESTAVLQNNESLTGLFQRPDATMEQFWVALFQERMNHNPYGPGAFILASSNSSSNSTNPSLLLLTQLPTVFGILLPWLVGVILGVFLPVAALLRELYKRGVRMSERKRRKYILLKCLEEYQKLLSPRDWVDPKNHDQDDDDDDIDHDNNVGRWKLPLAGSPISLPLSSRSQSPSQRQSQLEKRDDDALLLLERHVVGDCAICLTQYACGETLTWSSNPKCVHCFHQGCIVSWLSKRRNREQKPCPCCRQSFVVL